MKDELIDFNIYVYKHFCHTCVISKMLLQPELHCCNVLDKISV